MKGEERMKESERERTRDARGNFYEDPIYVIENRILALIPA